MSYLPELNKINHTVVVLNQELYHLWVDHMLFTWRWWLLAALFFIPWVVWFYIRKKDSTQRLLYAGVFMILVSSFLNYLGMVFGLWAYPVKLIPLVPPFMPWDTSLLPVVTMLMIQYYPDFSPWIKSLVFSALGTFGLQPAGDWLGLTEHIHWPNYYSFPILALLYLAAHWLATRPSFKELDD